jgi:hypothetical protein
VFYSLAGPISTTIFGQASSAAELARMQAGRGSSWKNSHREHRGHGEGWKGTPLMGANVR